MTDSKVLPGSVTALDNELPDRPPTREPRRGGHWWDALYEAIKHGDEEHRAWLREALNAYFTGLPVPAPRPAPAPRKTQP